MANVVKTALIEELRRRFGEVRKIKGSESLFDLGHSAARLYIRYSKVHPRGRTFFGLREVELRQLAARTHHLPYYHGDRREEHRTGFLCRPADEITAATSVVEKIPSLTRDRRILKSRLVPLAG